MADKSDLKSESPVGKPMGLVLLGTMLVVAPYIVALSMSTMNEIQHYAGVGVAVLGAVLVFAGLLAEFALWVTLPDEASTGRKRGIPGDGF